MTKQQSRPVQCLALAVALVSTIGCSGSSASSPTVLPSGEFRVVLPARPFSLNPNLELDESAYVVGRSIFSHLVAINEAGRVLPELAEAWTVSSDGLTYTFRLSPGVRWHDGTPFSADDVRWTMDMVGKDGVGRDAMAPVERIEAPDARTLVFRLKYPWAPFLSDLGGLGLAILPRHLYGGTDWRSNPANVRPVGTGPFRFTEWRPDGSIVLDANPNYFRSGPFVERVVFASESPERAFQRLTEGAADYTVTRPRSEDLMTIGDDSPLRVQSLPTSARYYLVFNLRRRPFDDERVRRAIAAAVDRLDMVRRALQGRGAPAVGWYTPDVEWAYHAGVRVPDLDLQSANRLLNEAGLPRRNRGARLRTTLLAIAAPPLDTLAEVLAEQLETIGIGVEVILVSAGDWPRRVLEGRDFDLTLLSGAQGPDPDALRRRFAGSGPGAYVGYDSAAFNAAVERGARSIDLPERARAYYEAQEILAADVPFVPLAESVKLVVYNRRVSGLPQLEARGLVGAFDFSLIRLQPSPGDSRR